VLLDLPRTLTRWTNWRQTRSWDSGLRNGVSHNFDGENPARDTAVNAHARPPEENVCVFAGRDQSDARDLPQACRDRIGSRGVRCLTARGKSKAWTGLTSTTAHYGSVARSGTAENCPPKPQKVKRRFRSFASSPSASKCIVCDAANPSRVQSSRPAWERAFQAGQPATSGRLLSVPTRPFHLAGSGAGCSSNRGWVDNRDRGVHARKFPGVRAPDEDDDGTRARDELMSKQWIWLGNEKLKKEIK